MWPVRWIASLILDPSPAPCEHRESSARGRKDGWQEAALPLGQQAQTLSGERCGEGGGWKDVQTMQRSYQYADPETVESVILAPEAALQD